MRPTWPSTTILNTRTGRGARRRTGSAPLEYQEKLVGENIAYGPKTADEVVQGWLDSPGHCANIMDPRFAEMGIAYAAGRASKRGSLLGSSAGRSASLGASGDKLTRVATCCSAH